jgi:hypothetical protein
LGIGGISQIEKTLIRRLVCGTFMVAQQWDKIQGICWVSLRQPKLQKMANVL